MGASFDFEIFDGDLNKNELYEKFIKYQENQEYEHGQYGTLATTDGLKFHDEVFDNEKKAADYVADNTEKYGNSLAVKFKITKTVFQKEATFFGECVGETESCLRSIKTKSIRYSEKNGTSPADQLSESDKQLIQKYLEDYRDAIGKKSMLNNKILRLLDKFKDSNKEFTEAQFEELKKIRLELIETHEDLKEKKSKFKDLDKKLSEELYSGEAKETVDIKWFVGGWCVI